jgi:hypothetical protein
MLLPEDLDIGLDYSIAIEILLWHGIKRQIHNDLFSELHVLLPDTLEIELLFSITNDFVGTGWLTFLVPLRVCVIFWVSQISMSSAKHVKKAIKKAGKPRISSQSTFPYPHYSPQAHKRKVHLNAAVSRTRLPSSLVAQMYHIEVQMPPWLGMGISFSTSTG